MSLLSWCILLFALGVAVASFFWIIIYALHNKDRDAEILELREYEKIGEVEDE